MEERDALEQFRAYAKCGYKFLAYTQVLHDYGAAGKMPLVVAVTDTEAETLVKLGEHVTLTRMDGRKVVIGSGA